MASSASNILDRVFSSCAKDPKGSIHRAWGISLIFVIIFFVIAVFETTNLHTNGGAKALVIAAIWTGIAHVGLGVLGTFVLKRFPTSFSVGFFLGVLVILANQNLIMFGTFHGYSHGNPSTNHIFSNFGFALFMILTFFSVLLFHFKTSIVVAPIDAKGNQSTAGKSSSEDYQKYEEGR